MTDEEYWDKWDYPNFNEMMTIHFQIQPRWPAVYSVRIG
jgi:hypothetical protein